MFFVIVKISQTLKSSENELRLCEEQYQSTALFYNVYIWSVVEKIFTPNRYLLFFVCISY